MEASERTANWAKSPEALFLTTDETKAWRALKTDDERTKFGGAIQIAQHQRTSSRR